MDELKNLMKNHSDWMLIFALALFCSIIVMKLYWLVGLVGACWCIHWLDSSQQQDPQQWDSQQLEFTLDNSAEQALAAVFDSLQSKGISQLSGEEIVKACYTAKLDSYYFDSRVASYTFNLTPKESDEYLAYTAKQLTYFAQQALINELVRRYGYPLHYQASFLGCDRDPSGKTLTITLSNTYELVSKDDAFDRKDDDF